METKGYLLVATLTKPFYDAMVMCVESLKDEVPDAKVAVFTHEEWVRDEDRHLFDHLITPVPAHCRTKLWALPQTPFDITCYLDVDGFVLNNEIEEVFDLIGDADVIMSENRPYNAKVVYFTHDDQVGPGIPGAEITHFKQEDIELYKQGKAHKFRWHCGMFVWRKNERTQKLWEQWLYWYKKHTIELDTGPFPDSLKYWDTFAFWRALYENPELNVNIQRMPNDAKYNFVTGYKETELRHGSEKAFLHYTIDPAKTEKREAYIINETGFNFTYGSFDRFK